MPDNCAEEVLKEWKVNQWKRKWLGTSKWWYSIFYWVPALKIVEGIKYWSPSSKSSHRIESKTANNSWPQPVLLYPLTSYTLATLGLFLKLGLGICCSHWLEYSFSWSSPGWFSLIIQVWAQYTSSKSTLSKVASMPSTHSISPCFTFPPRCLLISEICYLFITFARWKVSSTMAGILSFWSTSLSPVLRTMFGLE